MVSAWISFELERCECGLPITEKHTTVVPAALTYFPGGSAAG
jgi:hypothetical protein